MKSDMQRCGGYDFSRPYRENLAERFKVQGVLTGCRDGNGSPRSPVTPREIRDIAERTTPGTSRADILKMHSEYGR